MVADRSWQTDEYAALLSAPKGASRAARIVLVLFVLLLFGALEAKSPDPNAGSGLEQVVWTLTYLVAIAGLIVERKRALLLLRHSVPVAALIALIVLSSFWSDYHDISFKRALELVGTSAAAYYVATHFTYLEFLEGWATGVGTAALLSFALIFGMPSRGIMQDEYAGAWQGLFVHKNSLGQAMALGLVTLIMVAYAAGRAGRPKRTIFIGIAFAALLLIGSQSATSYIISAILCAIVGQFALSRSAFGRRIVPFAVGIGAIVVAFIALNLDAVVGAFGRDTSLSGRTDIWPPVIEAIGKRPWFGYGYDTFWLPDGTGSAYLTTLLEWSPYHAHNGLLELSLDIGLVGTALFLVTLVIGLWRAIVFARRQSDISRLWPIVAMVYFIAGNITEANIAKFNGMNWVIFLVAFLYVSVPRADADAESVPAPLALALPTDSYR